MPGKNEFIRLFILKNKKLKKKSKMKKIEFSVFASLLITSIIPWLIVLIWYIIPALYGKIHSDLYEILWAFFVLIVAGLIGINIEKNINKVDFSKTVKIFIIFIFVLSCFFFTFFTFFKPWIDLFQIP